MKTIMALTGVLFVLYLLAHMYGNLKVLCGPETFDSYAHHLRILGEPILPYEGFLWIARVVLVVSLVLHAGSAFHLWKVAATARGGQRYAVKKHARATYAARTMRWGGVILLLFVIFHILQYTTNTIRVNGDHDSPYLRVVAGFQVWYVVLIYLIAMLAVAFHLRHGVWSACQTLGLSNNRREKKINFVATAVAAVVAIGFIIPPLCIFFGIVGKGAV